MIDEEVQFKRAKDGSGAGCSCMGYHISYPDVLELYEKQDWISWDETERLLQYLNSVGCEPSQISMMSARCPFDRGTRFPPHGKYMCENVKAWRKVRRLLHALLGKKLLMSKREFRKECRKTSHQIYILVVNHYHALHDRASFESTFSLQWRDDVSYRWNL